MSTPTTGLVRPLNGNDDDLNVPAQAANPFGTLAAREAKSTMGDMLAMREVAEVQGQLMIAKKFPRDERVAVDRMLAAFQRPGLAEKAQYEYPRGGQKITGPSIRAAEAMGRAWGNMTFGWRVVDESEERATIETMCWDMETNVRAVRSVHVEMRMKARGEMKKLEDPRDRYEHMANMAARRMRACILEMLPGDVVDTCMAQAEATMRMSVDVTPEKVKSVITTFEGYNVSREALEKKLGRNIESMTPANMVWFRKILISIKDGMSKPEDYFDVSQTIDQEIAEDGKDGKKVSKVAARIAEDAAKLEQAKKTQNTQDKETLANKPEISAAAAVDYSKFTAEQLANVVDEAAVARKIPPSALALILRAHASDRLTAKNVVSVLAEIEKRGGAQV